MKVDLWKDCCYNLGPVTEKALASIRTDLLLQYPARRKAAEAQIPRLNRMFAGRALGHVVALDELKPRILYFVKDLTAADVARVGADKSLSKVQLANSAYAAGDVEALVRGLREEGALDALTPQLKAAYLRAFGVQLPSLVSVNALPDAVFIQQGREEAHGSGGLLQTLQAHFGEQLLAVVWNDASLGHALVLGQARVRAVVYQPTFEQMAKLRGNSVLRHVFVLESSWSAAEIENMQRRLTAVLMPMEESARHGLVNLLEFDYVRRKFNIGVAPGKLDVVSRLLASLAEMPANCCVLREQTPMIPVGVF